MQLQKIPNEVCPDCGSRTVAEHRPWIHSNGEPYETRQFECGCLLEYSPNFSKLFTKRPCPKNHEVVNMRRKRQDVKESLIKTIKDASVDDGWRGYVQRTLENLDV